MENNGKTGEMAANFKVPDTYGCTVGLTRLYTTKQSPHIYVF